MNYDELEHAIRAACSVANDTELFIFGSQAILGSFPNAPESIRASIEVDVQPKNHPELADALNGPLGELSPFHQAYGFYVHGLPIDEAAILPVGWADRTITVCHPVGTRGYKGHCVEAHDLAASKLAAYREKDREFVTVLLAEGLIDVNVLLDRIEQLPPGRLPVGKIELLRPWVIAISDELGLR